MRNINLTILIFLVTATSTFAQMKMNIRTNYNIPTSSNFDESFNNGIGATGELFYFINETNFSASMLIGMTTFRATEEYEQKLEDSNPTLFDYDYRINYYTFPVIVAGNYTFFNDDKFNLRIGFGAGVQFMELKKKLIGTYVSDTHKDYFNEFAIYPNIDFSYEIGNKIDLSISGSYNQTFGDLNISYVSAQLGIQYEI